MYYNKWHRVFFPFKKWQKLVILSLIIFITNYARVSFLQEISYSKIVSILFILVVLIGLLVISDNIKINMTSEGFYVEKSFLGYNIVYYAWDEISIFQISILFKIIIVQSKNKTFVIIPFFWGEKYGEDISCYF